jgi:hypothetical protein
MSTEADRGRREVVLVDLDISFLRLVMFFVKATLAAIPAAIIVSLFFMLLAAILGALFGMHPWWANRSMI